MVNYTDFFTTLKHNIHDNSMVKITNQPQDNLANNGEHPAIIISKR
ncbi:hypothetical protein M595_1006 [Lyngbya aestuarii BL J]|uniref:Uncharacterized protein n=1 Tax=Lyngbya aestuarii BL J TaxID=1348334 RepID=U7QM63_9CYAN|nr:hypothetical protein M595_1006 [Lyngbya aestuarii BL J]